MLNSELQSFDKSKFQNNQKLWSAQCSTYITISLALLVTGDYLYLSEWINYISMLSGFFILLVLRQINRKFQVSMDAIKFIPFAALALLNSIGDGKYFFGELLAVLLMCMAIFYISELDIKSMVVLWFSLIILLVIQPFEAVFSNDFYVYHLLTKIDEDIDYLNEIEPLDRFIWFVLGKSLFIPNSNEVGFLAMVSVISAINMLQLNKYRCALWTQIILSILVLLLSQSRSALGILLVYTVYLGKFIVPAIVIAPLLVIGQFFGDELIYKISGAESNSDRIELLIKAVNIFAESKLIGVGLEELYGQTHSGPHNMYIHALVKGGVVTGIPLILSLLYFYIRDPLVLGLFLVFCFFTHNVIDSPIYIVGLYCLFVVRRNVKQILYDRQITNFTKAI